MIRHRTATCLILAGLLAVGGWLGWTWYAAPAVPEIALDGIDKELRDAIEAAVDKVRRQPRSAEAWGELSLVLVANGFNVQAIPCLAQTELLDPLNPRWPYWRGQLLATDPDQCLPLLRRASELATLPEDRAGILIRLTMVLIENGDLEEAAERLETLKAIDRHSSQVHYHLGLLAIARENRADAREYLGRLVDNPYFRKRACSLLATVAEGDAALAYKQQAAKLPDDAASLNSFEIETRAYQVNADDPLARFNELGREGRVEEAVDYLRNLAAQSANDKVSFALGYTLLTLNKVDEAEQHLRNAVHNNPRHVKANLYHGIALLMLGENRSQETDGAAPAAELFRGAVAAEDRALTGQPDLVLAHITRGAALKRLERLDEALRSFREAVRYGPEVSEARRHLGEALAETGQLSEALEHLQIAARVADAKDPRPLQALAKWQAKMKSTP